MMYPKSNSYLPFNVFDQHPCCLLTMQRYDDFLIYAIFFSLFFMNICIILIQIKACVRTHRVFWTIFV